jgi:hypothetical protein
MALALLGVMALPARGERAGDGPKVGQWKTWVLASGTDISYAFTGVIHFP